MSTPFLPLAFTFTGSLVHPKVLGAFLFRTNTLTLFFIENLAFIADLRLTHTLAGGFIEGLTLWTPFFLVWTSTHAKFSIPGLMFWAHSPINALTFTSFTTLNFSLSTILLLASTTTIRESKIFRSWSFAFAVLNTFTFTGLLVEVGSRGTFST